MSTLDDFPQQPTQPWDVWLVVNGKDGFNATADNLVLVSVAAPNISAVRTHRNILRVLAKQGSSILDVCPSGVSSPAVLEINNRSRRAADAAARERFSRDGADPQFANLRAGAGLGKY